MHATLRELEQECPALVKAIGTDIQNEALYELVEYIRHLNEQQEQPAIYEDEDIPEGRGKLVRFPVFELINLERTHG